MAAGISPEDQRASRVMLQILESRSQPLSADLLLMGASNFERPRSGPARVRCTVQFINRANCVVDVYWISRKGLSSLYQILQPNKVMVVNTYAGHLWHFCHVRNSHVEWLKADQEFIYNVQESNNYNGRPAMQEVNITLPLYPLQDWCKRLIIQQVKRDDIKHLPLPKRMKENLGIYSNNHLSDKLKTVESASLVRKRKDQLVHLFGQLIRGMFLRQTFTPSASWNNLLENFDPEGLNHFLEMFRSLAEVPANRAVMSQLRDILRILREVPEADGTTTGEGLRTDVATGISLGLAAAIQEMNGFSNTLRALVDQEEEDDAQDGGGQGQEEEGQEEGQGQEQDQGQEEELEERQEEVESEESSSEENDDEDLSDSNSVSESEGYNKYPVVCFTKDYKSSSYEVTDEPASVTPCGFCSSIPSSQGGEGQENTRKTDDDISEPQPHCSSQPNPSDRSSKSKNQKQRPKQNTDSSDEDSDSMEPSAKRPKMRKSTCKRSKSKQN